MVYIGFTNFDHYVKFSCHFNTNQQKWVISSKFTFLCKISKKVGKGTVRDWDIYVDTRHTTHLCRHIYLECLGYMNKFHVNCFLSHVNILSKLHVGIDRLCMPSCLSRESHVYVHVHVEINKLHVHVNIRVSCIWNVKSHMSAVIDNFWFFKSEAY